ncbi:MAG: hypothetical protein HXX09_17235, partial [Bacteroidetes bacterium]|nr:hypothetical protein [Bacteroidota bacterium]
MKKIVFILFFLISFVAKNQNLVPNPSFEQFYTCPTGLSQFDGYVKQWYSANTATPNYLNRCALVSTFASVPNNLNGCFQNARTGNAYSVFETYGYSGDDTKEYISITLSDTLKLNKKYIIGFYLSLTNGNDINSGSTYAIDRMGVYLTDTIFHFAQPFTIPVNPQVESPAGLFFKDTLNWMLCSFEYIAQGNEKCITIGNFHFSDSTNNIQVSNSIRYTAVYYIDDVFVYAADEVQTAEAGNNITICKGDSIKIGMPTDTGYTYQWLPATGLSNDTIG